MNKIKHNSKSTARSHAFVVILGLCGVLSPVCDASPPTNDDFADRSALGSMLGAAASGTMVDATSEVSAGEPDLSFLAMYGGSDDFTVWYEWTAPAGAEWLRIALSGTNLPTVLSAYTGSGLPGLNQVALNRREIAALPNRLTFPVIAGTTYQIRASVERNDFESYSLAFPPPVDPVDMGFDLALTAIESPVTAADYVLRGRGWFETGDGADFPNAVADFAAALAIDPTVEEARFLRAIIRLLMLDSEPATDTLFAQLGAPRTVSFLSGGDVTVPTDIEGIPIPGIGSRSGMAVDWIRDEFLPRLVTIREDLSLITSTDFRTDLISRESGEGDVYVDRGDVLAFSAATHGLELLFNILFTYDLDVSLESLYILDKHGWLSAEDTLAVFSSLLEFSASDGRLAFATAMRAMEQDYLAASEFVRNERSNPGGLSTEGVISNPVAEEEFRDTLSTAVMSLDGEVTFDGVRVNLSRLVATDRSLRDWMPQFSIDNVVPGTFSDPTFDGVLPGLTTAEMENRIHSLGRLWGMAQYSQELGNFIFPGGPRDDADGDGRDNFSEWLFHTNAVAQDILWQDLTREAIAPGEDEIRLSFARRKDLNDWRLIVSVSDDMESWDRTEAQVEMVGPAIDNGDGFTETVTYRLTGAAALSVRKFMRLEAVPK